MKYTHTRTQSQHWSTWKFKMNNKKKMTNHSQIELRRPRSEDYRNAIEYGRALYSSNWYKNHRSDHFVGQNCSHFCLNNKWLCLHIVFHFHIPFWWFEIYSGDLQFTVEKSIVFSDLVQSGNVHHQLVSWFKNSSVYWKKNLLKFRSTESDDGLKWLIKWILEATAFLWW